MKSPIDFVKDMYILHFNDKITNITPLAESGSYRQYFKITAQERTVLGVYNNDLQENKAYLSFSETFLKAKINIPNIISISEDQKGYLVEYLGDNTLCSIVEDSKINNHLSEHTIQLYKKSIKELIKIQTQTIDHLDTSFCYPRDAFDKQSILWDLNYFKYFFLRLTRIPFDEQKLENDFQALSEKLDSINRNYFLFRDFQSRNIMIKDDQPFFIDFQGGRKGSVYYDLASLVFDANVELCVEDRKVIIDYYFEQFNKTENTRLDIDQFNMFGMVRLMQALGAFGLRGLVEKKPHFKECIPYAVETLHYISEKLIIYDDFNELKKIINYCKSVDFKNINL